VALLFPSGPGFLDAFLAVLHAGGVAVPLPPASGIRSAAAYVERLQHILRDAEAGFLLVGADLERDIEPLFQRDRRELRVLRHAPLAQLDAAAAQPCRAPDYTTELALIQYTSGSTSAPKGVPLSHDNLLAGLRAVQAGARLTASDLTALWLPMHHDMGLIGALATLLSGADMALWSPLDFVRQPFRWLESFAAMRATVYAGPSFSYASMLHHAQHADLRALDLSAWRVACNGAEVIDVAVMQRFTDHFAAAGFRPETMFPVYGLAEATLAVTFPRLGSVPELCWVDAQRLADERRVVRVAPGRGRALVCVGQPVQDHEVRVVDEAGRTLPQDRVGEICVRGPAVMQGYLGREPAARGVDVEGWLSTGDLGFIDAMGLFVTGRAKEMIIVRGHNYYPQDVEAVVAALPGVYKGRCVALAVGSAGGETMAVAVEHQRGSAAAEQALVARIREHVLDTLGLDELMVHTVKPHALPRTTSGKYQRLRMRHILMQTARTGELT
jgi:acyl-CoA synthetase (AMP-forming)/AMP-acid ligase II